VKNRHFIIFLLIILLFSIIIDLSSGSVKFNILKIFFKNDEIPQIITDIRIPRMLTAILTGISLSTSGLLLQTLFKNPLAGPYIFGISSGASLGVAVLLMGLSFVGITTLPGNLSIALAGIIGAGAILFIILILSLKINDTLTILIIGVLLGGGISAIVNIMQYFSNANLLKKYVIWTMGSLDAIQKEQLIFLSLITLIPIILTIIFSKYIDGLYLGDENAKTLGINVKKVRILIFAVTGITTGVITAFCGPIGFIGIAVPHLGRIIFKTSKHSSLLIYSSLIGAIIMLLSDSISHSFGSQIIPINSITALIGIPIIIWVIFKNKRFI